MLTPVEKHKMTEEMTREATHRVLTILAEEVGRLAKECSEQPELGERFSEAFYSLQDNLVQRTQEGRVAT